MSVQRYRYTHNGEDGVLLVGKDHEPYRFQTQDGNAYPLALDDLIDLDTPQAAFLAQADALVGAWRELCESVTDVPDPQAARQTLRDCLDVMRRAMDTDGGTDPDPALALKRVA